MVVVESQGFVYNNFRNLTAYDIEDIYVIAIVNRPAIGRGPGEAG